MSPFLLITAFVAALADTGACRPVSGLDAHALLERAAARVGLDSARRNVLEVRGYDVRRHAFESDRMYPPYLAEVATLDEWLDPASGVERTASQTTIGGYEFGSTTMGDARASYIVRDTALVPSEAEHGAMYETRPLDVWAVLTDWLAAPDVRATKQCTYRDYPRLVLERRGVRGAEQLYLDPKSAYPVKLDRMERHYLWGQVHVEYVWSTWEREGAVHLPGAAFRMDDGETEIARVFGVRRMVPRDSAPRLTLPARESAMTPAVAAFLTPSRPDTARVSDHVFVLRNGGYGEVVALDRDTVFVFDATQGEERVRQDAIWIAALFPGHHPIVLVVTDLAWPHVAGVRAWVARGATVVGHRAARSFLERVVNRRWTLAPDLLERRRAQAPFRFRAVNDSISLAGGDIVVFPIDGAASEVALAAFVRPSKFLWASDFVQDLDAPTQYVDEVAAAVRRVGITPSVVAAEHVKLAQWSRVAALADPAADP
ncbi:MAG TPA: hypothetical protein VGR59_09355 [Gemmatimonadaceae bacterium]|nr:hypothetical protein [Gemmatimonadaceae bacterium]